MQFMLEFGSEVEDMSVSSKEAVEADEPLPFSEFDQPRWSVISMDDCAASGLSYTEAARLVKQMSEEVTGLCIVTDAAARKMCGNGTAKTRKAKEPDEDLSQKSFADIL